jgi:4-coumarate--CoA ligase
MPSPRAKIHHSPLPSLPIPPISVPTFIFTSGTPASRLRPQYFSADAPSRNFSLTQAEILVKRIALGLQNLGLKPNDKVLLYAGNSLWFPVLFWGVIAAECVFSGCSPGASVSELAYQLRDSDARVLLCSAGVAEKARQAAREVGLDEGMVFEFCDPDTRTSSSGLKLWTSFWAGEVVAQKWKWREFTTTTGSQTTAAVLNYSSGTTGLPKGVLISHYNLISNSLQVLHKRNMVADNPAAKARAARLALSGERWLAPLPMFHAYGQAYYCMSAAVSGTKVFIMPQYEIQRYLNYLDTYRITFLTGVPTLMTSLAKIAPEGMKLNAIESVVTGSAPLDPAVGRMVEKKLLKEGVNVKQGWGMTECTCSATGFAPDDIDDGRSIGWINPNVSCKIVPVEGREFGAESGIAFAIGEIWIAGPNIMMGYYKKEEATRETIVHEDGIRWLKTGDIGYVDDRGCIYIIDRLKVNPPLALVLELPVANIKPGAHQSQRLASCPR